MPLSHSDLFHAAWVVPDLAVAMDSFRTVGLRLTEPREWSIVVGRPNLAPTSFSILAAFSCDGPLHVELIEGAAGSPWEPLANGAMHHLGWWVSDLRQSIAMLESESHVLESWMVGDDGGPARFAYLRAPGGQLVEIVDETIRPDLTSWFRGEAQV